MELKFASKCRILAISLVAIENILPYLTCMQFQLRLLIMFLSSFLLVLPRICHVQQKVWAIGHDDRCLYYRTGITRSELTGKKWRLINAPLQLSRASSNASLSSSNRHSTCGTPQQQHHQSWGSLVVSRISLYGEMMKLDKQLDPNPSVFSLFLVA